MPPLIPKGADASGADVAWDLIAADAYIGKKFDGTERLLSHAVALRDFTAGRLRLRREDVLCRKVKPESMCRYFETKGDRHEHKCADCAKRIAKHRLAVYE